MNDIKRLAVIAMLVAGTVACQPKNDDATATVTTGDPAVTATTTETTATVEATTPVDATAPVDANAPVGTDPAVTATESTPPSAQQ